MSLRMALEVHRGNAESDDDDKEIGFWKNMYPIHDWFLDNVAPKNEEYCDRFEVPTDKLIDLLEKCLKVLFKRGDFQIAGDAAKIYISLLRKELKTGKKDLSDADRKKRCWCTLNKSIKAYAKPLKAYHQTYQDGAHNAGYIADFALGFNCMLSEVYKEDIKRLEKLFKPLNAACLQTYAYYLLGIVDTALILQKAITLALKSQYNDIIYSFQ